MARMAEAAGFPAGYLGDGSTGYPKVALAYKKAGADLVLLSMAPEPEQLRATAERFGGPLMYLAGRGGLAGLGLTGDRRERQAVTDRTTRG